MKHIVTLTFLTCFLLSCQGRSQGGCLDLRCSEIMAKALKEAEASGCCGFEPFCYNGPLINLDKRAEHLNPEKCRTFYKEGRKKCDALPQPPGPDDIKYLDNVLEGGEIVMIDGKPACLYFEL